MPHDLDLNAQVSPHFLRGEFACKCGCRFAQPDPELLEVLEAVRRYYNKPVVINSGCRCKAHNASVGGSPNSAHMQGIAADIEVRDVSPSEVQALLLNWFKDRYGIGTYNTFTHIDVRKDKARW